MGDWARCRPSTVGGSRDTSKIVNVFRIEVGQLVHSYLLRFLALALGAKLPLTSINILQRFCQIFGLKMFPGGEIFVLVSLCLFGIRCIFAFRFAFLGTVLDQVRTLAFETLGFASGFAGIVALWQLGGQSGPSAIGQQQQTTIRIVDVANESQWTVFQIVRIGNQSFGIGQFVFVFHRHDKIKETVNFAIEVSTGGLCELVQHVRASTNGESIVAKHNLDETLRFIEEVRNIFARIVIKGQIFK